ncbi:MAG: hypothetical protein EZS28_043513 [Streblomastix strix]|uniref:KilA-N domain-containing protein n=1 Tax=Streblomastix strix TaxID=222440 RepID=A0A5J4TSK1_9EUKA|nr:MAG: hypothetical protein EZS28_043513 [Streblomastix strix]
MTQVETASILQNDVQFINVSYNGMTILVRQSDGYINATQFCEQYGKQFRSLIKYDKWKDYIKAESEEGQPELNISGSFMYIIDKGYANDLKGYYVHPILINYIAIWISPKYAVTVRKIMDSINENSQQTHTTFEVNTSRLLEQLQRENINYSNTIQQMEPRLVPQDKQYDYIYSVELINEDIDGRGIIMKNLGFTIPNDQDVDEIMNQIRQTITERSIY